MKRCPQCLFIYPESDERCDFDQTPLIVVADSEIDGAVKSSVKSNRRFLPIFGATAVALLIVFLVLFLGFRKATNNQEQASTDTPVTAATPIPEPPAPTPSPSPSSSPSSSPSPTPSPTRVATSHSRTSVDPVSTSGPGMGSRRGGKTQILLSSGGKIDADEVWRTRDGYWYRKNGMVTLLKHSQVKAVINR